MKKFLLSFCFLLLSFFFLLPHVHAQNTLNNLGLSASDPSVVAYSLRRLSTSYTGNAIQVRRSSDNTTQDIGFNGSGDLDQTALLSFVGSGNGFVSIWYDQSGNSRNLTASAQTNEPSIVTAGAVNTVNSKPTVLFDGTNDYLTHSSFPTSGFSGFSANMLCRWTTTGTTTATIQVLLDNDVNTQGFRFQDRPDLANRPLTMDYSGAVATDGVTTGNGALKVFSMVTDATNVKGYSNGSLFQSTSRSGAFLHNNVLTIGAWTNGPSRFLNGAVPEIVIFPDALSDLSRQALECNQSSYYAVTLSGPVPSVSIAITSGTNPVCNTGSVTFTATPTNGGAAPAYQWTRNGTNISGASSSTYTGIAGTNFVNGDLIRCVLTSNASCANPTTATSSAITMTVTPQVTPSVSIAITSGSNPVCNTGSVTFTATPTNGGATPAYQWTLNGTNISGAASSTYTGIAGADFVSGDLIRCVLTSSASCPSPATATSSAITMTVNPQLTPSVSIAITSGTNPVCNTASLTFTAVPVNGGTTPGYQWTRNGTNIVGATSSTYTGVAGTAFVNGDLIRCVLTSNATCATPTTATSSAITLTVTPLVTPSVSIAITSGTNPVCNTASVTFTATPTNGGASPSYQWTRNGTNIVGATSSTFTGVAGTDFVNGNQIRCVMTSNAACPNPLSATSSAITMSVTANTTPSVSIAITSGSNPVCNASSVTFTATPVSGGSTPSYQWTRNGTNITGANSVTYTGVAGTAFVNGDLIRCVMTSNSVCPNPAVVTSAAITMTVTPNVTPSVSVSITTGSNPVCNAVSVTFTANPVNGGTTPGYQWTRNGTNIAGATSSTFTGVAGTAFVDGDLIRCVMTSIGVCGIPATVTSAPVTMVVANGPPAAYITGQLNASSCFRAEEAVSWRSLNNTAIAGAASNSLIKTASGGAWDGGAFSYNPVFNNGYLQFVATETNTERMIGLATTNPNNSFGSIRYAIYLTAGSTFQIYENGAARGTFGMYAANDTFRVSAEGGVIRYYKNNAAFFQSLLVPSFPMFVDVSINTLNGTITDARVSNLNSGDFNAFVPNGTPSLFQWRLNGTPVGSNASTYSNATLTPGDVITCDVTLTATCGGAVVNLTSNQIIYNNLPVYTTPSAIVTGVVNSAACTRLEEEVRWRSLVNTITTGTGNSLEKTSPNGGWDAGAFSHNSVSNNGYLEFTVAETNTDRMLGLSNTNTDNSIGGIRYAIFLINNSNVGVYENGVSRGTFGIYATGDVFRISAENGVIRYYRNNNVFYVSNLTPTFPLFADLSISTPGGTLTDVFVSNLNDGSFSATLSNATALTYQWKLNGTPVGTNASTYTNAGISVSDVVTCDISYQGICATPVVASNYATFKNLPSYSVPDIYINGVNDLAACTRAEERVVWRSLASVIRTGTGNSLQKFASDGSWDGGAFSYNSVSNNGYLEFTATETTTARMVGLSSSNLDNSFGSIRYAIYLTSGSSVQIYENGIFRGTFGNYSANDVFRVSAENGAIRYYRNNLVFYTSPLAPVFPLFADVSILSINGTVTNALISNLNSGSYTASIANATALNYQWTLNGLPVGSNAPSYSNPSVNVSDIIGCTISYQSVCGTPSVASNTITHRALPVYSPPIGFITSVVNTSACARAEEQVRWGALASLSATGTGNSLQRTSSIGGWDGGAFSFNSVSNNGYLEFTATETNTERMVGLSPTNTDNSYTSIRYAIFLQNGSTFMVYENGIPRGSFGAYASNDVFRVSAENNAIRYYRNNNLFYTSTVAPTFPLYADVSVNSTNGTVTNALISNLNSGSFTAGISGGTPLSYQWTLNGAPVGTNSASYSNPAINVSDVVACTMTYQSICATPSITSNTITRLALPTYANPDVFISAVVDPLSCSRAEEQVRWRSLASVNITGAGNSLVKFANNGPWDGAAFSYNSVSDNGYLEFTATETNTQRMVGLSNTNADNSYTSITYAIYLQSNATFSIYESGVFRANFGVYAANDVFRVSAENGVIRYYRNNVVFYLSTVVPTFPLFADVSISNINGTVTNALISNLNSGSFTATMLNATPLSYQWRLNGTAVGGNISTYANTALNVSDVVTCNITFQSICATPLVSSNTITRRALPTYGTPEVYITGVVNPTSCNRAEEVVRWRSLASVVTTGAGNSLQKTASNGNWDGGAFSYNTVSNNGYLEFTATETNTNRMVGLGNTNPDNSFPSIAFAIYLQSNASVGVFESGVSRGNYGTYAANDVFRVSVENGVVRYYRNNNVFYVSNVTPVLPLFADVSINNINGTVTNAFISNLNGGSFTATMVGATPLSYQWRLNGNPVGSNSATYSNPGISLSDVVNCTVTYQSVCSTPGFASNNITYRPLPTYGSPDMFISGVVNQSSCAFAEELVRWRFLSSVNTAGTGNSLIKTASPSSWNGGAYSYNSVVNNGFLEFTATETNTDRMVGLSNNNTDNSFSSIRYAIYLVGNANLMIYENGISRGTFGTYSANDVFRVGVETGVVKYYRNNTVFYISNLVPTFPLFADVSLFSLNATVTDARISNLNSGDFTAFVANATNPNYQWRLNGNPVGANLSSYSNPGLTAGDVISCNVTIPGLCGGTTVNLISNQIIFRTLSAFSVPDVYITAVVNPASCRRAEEQVKWTGLAAVSASGLGNSLVKSGSVNNWNGGAFSYNSVSDNGYMQFVATEINSERMVGLSNSNPDNSFSSIRYAIYLQSNAAFQVYENGVPRGAFGYYAANDVFRVSVENGLVKYYRNNAVFFVSALVPSFPLFVDVSILTVGGTVTNVLVSNLNSGGFNAFMVGAAPLTYQWKLNGAAVGTNAPNYSNPAINVNDVVTCEISYQSVCAAPTIASNPATYRTLPTYSAPDFVIRSDVDPLTCNIAEEQVRWRALSSTATTGTGNSLVKNGPTSGWDGGAFSFNSVSNNGYFQFTATETNSFRMVGLANNNTDNFFGNIRYAIYLVGNSYFMIYESGISRGIFGIYAANDVFRIGVENGVVRYYRNNVVFYNSTIAPVLPLFADVSILTPTGTVTNALIGNLNSGNFTATMAGATALSYQWRLNGSPVGTNSPTYSNPTISLNDVVTCSASYQGICATPLVTSNNITYKPLPFYSPPDVVVRATVDPAACLRSEEEVRWRSLALVNTTGTGNSLAKVPSNAGWDAGAFSYNSVSNNGYLQFTVAETNADRMIGLSATNPDNSFASITYAIFLVSNANFQIYENGIFRGSFGLYATNDVFRISAENGIVRYYRNNVVFFNSNITPTFPLFADVSISSVNGTVSNALISNLSSGTFTASMFAATPLDYQWKLNGNPVGTNSPTYTEPSIAVSDVVTCEVSYVVGCDTPSVVSNNVIYRNLPTYGPPAVVVTGTVNPASCSRAEEQVRWRSLVSLNVTGGGTGLVKNVPTGNWDAAAFSYNQIANNGYLQFTATETNTERMIGLSSTDQNNSFSSIAFAIYLQSNTNFSIYENGVFRGTFGIYATNDVFRVSAENGIIRYYRNNVVFFNSSLTPVFPLFVDLSVLNNNASLNNILVSNLNGGGFSTSIFGASPISYQWRLNGAPVGTNASSYINPGIALSDVVTCDVTYQSICATGTLASNPVTYRPLPVFSPPDVVVAGTVDVNACNRVEEQVRWRSVAFANVTGAGSNSLLKNLSNGSWNGAAFSYNQVANNGYLQFTATETNTERMVGLSPTNPDNSFNNIAFAVHLQNNANLQVYESGILRGNFGLYSANDVFRISVENGVVRYYRNNNVFYNSTLVPTLPLFADVSIFTINGTVTNALISNLNSGSFSAASFGSVPVSYQWQLNGVPVGTNSSTYTNPALNISDAVTCVVTAQGICGAPAVTSNSATFRTLPAYGPPLVQVVGTPDPAGCLRAEEPVLWRSLANINTTGAGNSLSKISSNGAWDGGAFSCNSMVNNGYLQFTATETNLERVVGLSTTNTNNNFTSIRYAIYLRNNATVQVYENGTLIGTYGSYSANTVFRISADAGVIRYFRNNTLFHTSALAPVFPLFADVSILNVGATVTNAVIANPNYGSFSVQVTAPGTIATYQWKLNGTNVGTNSPTYTNTSVVLNDLVSCDVTYNTICSTPPLTLSAATMVPGSIAVPPTVSIAVSPSSTICNGASATFTATPANAGPSPTYQWTKNGVNIAGANAITYVALAGTDFVNTDVIRCLLSVSGICSGSVLSSPITMTVTPNTVPSVSIALTSGSNPACNTSSVTFTATPVNPGASPVYQWTRNGSNISGATSATYTAVAGTGFVDGDLIRCVLTSNAVCPSPASVTSAPIVMNVTPQVIPTISIAITSGSNPVCATGPVTFTATVSNEGATPTYQWTRNGSNISGANAITYSGIAGTDFVNGDLIRCVLTSSAACPNPASPISAAITMTVNPQVTPSVSIAITTGSNPVTTGVSVTFTATPVNGGASPNYQWTLNGTNIFGATASSYTGVAGTDFISGDLIACVMTSNATCPNPNTATSNSINMTVNPIVPSVVLSAPSQVAAANVLRGVNDHIISFFQADVTLTNATLSTLNFTTTGSYTASELTGNFQLWFNTSATFGTATSIGSVAAGGPSNFSFTGLSQTINNNTTGFFWITCNTNPAAVTPRTIQVSANPVLTFVLANVSGSVAAGGVQTIIPSVPTVLTNAIVTSITESTAQGGGNVTADGGANVNARGMVWNTSPAPVLPGLGSTTDGTGTGVFSSSLAGLLPETFIYARAYATNSAGSGYGSDVSFFTLSNPPIVQANTLLGNPVSSTQIDLSWDASVFPASGATVRGYLLVRATDPTLPVFTAINGTAPSVSSGVIVSPLIPEPNAAFSNTGLLASTTYNYLLIPYCWDGVNPETYHYLTSGAPTVSVTTPPAPCSAPSVPSSVVSFSSVSSSQMTVNFTAGNGTNRLVVVRAGSAVTASPAQGTAYNASSNFGFGDNLGSFQFVVYDGTSNSFTLTGLSPSTTYHFAIFEFNNPGNCYQLSSPATANQVTSSQSSVIETFEPGVKPAYPSGSSLCNLGVWAFNDALIGVSASDKKNGAKAARIQNNGSVYMLFDKPNGIGSITIHHASYDTDNASDWRLEVSDNGGATYSAFTSSSFTSGVSLTPQVISVNVPGNIRVRISKLSGGADRLNIDDISITDFIPANTITTTAVTGSPFCTSNSSGTSVNVPFTSTGTFGVLNVYTAQLSDASGSFSNPLVIGTLTSTLNSGVITASVPPALLAGNNYRIRVVSSSPAVSSANSIANPNALSIFNNAPEVSSVIAIPGNGQIALNWANPSLCFDEILIVAKALNPVTVNPSGNGSSYTANAVFSTGGSGANLPAGEFAVFKNTSGTTVTVSGLTNGTLYYFEIFTRKATLWSDGVIVAAVPSVPQIGDFQTRPSVVADWNGSSTWQTWNGSAWVNTSLFPDGVGVAARITPGAVITLSASQPLQPIKNLTIDAGGKLFTNSTTLNGNRYLTIYGNIICNGEIGNGALTYDNISFNMEGNPSVISGSGIFNASRIRKNFNVNTTSNLVIAMNVGLRYAASPSSSGTAVYNAFAGNTVFNITINQNVSLSIKKDLGLSADISIDGVDGLGSGERGGTITVNGTLNVEGYVYAFTNNTGTACALQIGSSGKVNCLSLCTGNSAATQPNGSESGGFTLSVFNGGLLNMNGNNAFVKRTNLNSPYTYSSGLGTVNQVYNLQAGSSVEYSAEIGIQAVQSSGLQYSNIIFSGGSLKKINSTLEVNRNLSILSPAIFEINGQQVNLGGNWLNYGSIGFLEGNAGKVHFNGTAAQNMICPGGEDFYNVDISNASVTGLLIDADIRVKNNLDLGSNGRLTAGNSPRIISLSNMSASSDALLGSGSATIDLSSSNHQLFIGSENSSFSGTLLPGTNSMVCYNRDQAMSGQGGSQQINEAMPYAHLALCGSDQKISDNSFSVASNLTIDGSSTVLSAVSPATILSLGGNLSMSSGASMNNNCLDNLQISTLGLNTQVFSGGNNEIKCFNLLSVKASGGITLQGPALNTGLVIKNDFSLNYSGTALFQDQANNITVKDDIELGGASSGFANYDFTGTMTIDASNASTDPHISDFAGSGIIKAQLNHLNIAVNNPTPSLQRVEVYPTSGGAALHVKGNLTILNTVSPSELDMNNNNLFISGNWSSYASTAFTEGTALVTFNGSATQTLACAGGEVFHDLALSNSASVGLTLNNILQVKNQMNFANGRMDLNGNDLTIGTSTSNGSVTGGNANSYAITWDGAANGNIVRNVATPGSLLYPVGDASSFSPITCTLNFATLNAATLTGSVTAAAHPNMTASTNYIQRYWSLVPSGITNCNYAVSYSYAAGDALGIEANLFPFKYNSSGWLGAPGSGAQHTMGSSSTTTPATRTLTWTDLYTFSDFSAFGNGTPLPISLMSFEASPVNDIVKTEWVTLTEINNDFFTVEKTQDGQSFVQVGKVNGAGNSNNMLSYTLYDENPFKGWSYYRLKQTDFDGNVTYSDLREVFMPVANTKGENDVNVSLSQFQIAVRLNYLPDSETIIELLDLNGKLISVNRLPAGSGTTALLPCEGLANGVYMVRTRNMDLNKTSKIILNH